MARRRRPLIQCGSSLVTISEQNAVTTRRLASLVLTIGRFIIFLGGGWNQSDLEKILEVFDCVIIKVALSMTHIILNVVFGESIEKNNFALLSSSSFS